MFTWLRSCCFWILLICVWRIRPQSIEQPPKIHPWDQDEEFLSEGDPLSINCNAEGSSLGFHWFRHGKPLASKDALLFLEKLSPEDSGEYQCSATNHLGTALSAPIKINVLYIYGFVEEPTRTLLVPVNSPFIIEAPQLNASKQILEYLTWRWYFESQPVGVSRDFYVAMSGDLIVLNPANSFGAYRAEVTYRGKKFISPDRVVFKDYSDLVQPKFGILYPPKNAVYRLGSRKSVVFECVPNQFDLPVSILWSVDGHAINDSNVEFRELDRRFILRNPDKVTSANKLEIGCTVRKGATLTEGAAVHLDLHERPRIKQGSFTSMMSEQVGGSLEIQCEASGYPDPDVMWLFNGHFFTNGSVLHLENVELKSFGLYQCEAVNAAGVAISDFWLKDKGRGSMTNLAVGSRNAPKIIENSENITTIMGSDLDLYCRFNGTPAPSITWKFNGKMISSGEKYRVSDDTLHIFSIQAENAGIYSCLGANKFGSDEATIAVQFDELNFIEYGPANVSILISSNCEIPCKVRDEYAGRDDTVVTWLWQDVSIPPNGDAVRRLTVKRNGLEIKQVGPDNIGIYTCRVRVGTKEQSMSGWLKIIEKPSMPRAVKAELLNDTVPARILVSWKQGFDGNSPLIKHIVEMRTLGPTGLWSDWETADENVPTEMCCAARIDNLKPSSTVEFRVIAVNRHGTGKPSSPSNNITMPQQPPAAAPRNVAVSARSPSSVMVQWQPPPPEQWNGDILGYIIRYRLANYASLPWVEETVSDGSKRNAALEQLITWREYEVQVAAYNHRGMGVFSKPLLVSTFEGVPTQAPKNVSVQVLNSTAIVVSFSPPDPQMIPGVNQGYKIDIWKGPVSSGRLYRQVKLLPDEANIVETISGLEKFGRYNITVLCYTTPGDGPRSEPVEVVTKEDLPGAVDSVRFDSVLFSSVDMLWEPPLERNGIIRKYVIRYWEDGKPENSQALDVEPESRNVTIDGLIPSTHYTVEVQAFTSVGGGPKVEAKFESGVPPELPGRPSSLEVSDIGSRTAMLRFAPGFDGHTFIRKWIVEAKLSTSSAFSPIFEIKAPKARSFVVEKLRPYAKYQLRLIAENIRGRSPPSDATEEFTTLQAEPDCAPELLFAEPVSATSISIVWTPLRSVQWNGNPKGYLIMYHAKNGDKNSGWKEIRVSNSKTGDFVLTDLRPYTLYEIELVAENSIGRSNRSEQIETKTYEDVPSGAPADVELILEKPKTAVVLWRPIEAGLTNGIVIGYKIRLVPEEERYRGEYSRRAEVDASTLKTTFAQLHPFMQYRAFVSAFTIVGAGPENSSASVQSPEDVPGEPYNVAFSYVGDSEVRLKWNPPLNPNGNVLNYEIMHWKNGNEKDATKIKLPFNVYGFSAIGLQKETHYKFAVSAETSVGWGPQAIVSVLTTNDPVPPPVPSMPQRNDARPQASTEIALKWNIPPVFTDDPDLNVVRFTEVEYQTYGSEWAQIPYPIAGPRNEAVITGLKPNTKYHARIRFNGDFGQSSWSAESPWIKTLEDAPSAPPVLLQASPFESSSLMLQWQPPAREEWNSDKIKFRILYRVYFSNETAKTEETDMPDDGQTKVQHTIEKLKSFRHYVAQVQTFNDLGSSPYSSPTFVYVGYSIPKRTVANLVAQPLSSTSLTVKWDPWEEHSDDVISGFKIRYTPVLPVLSNEENLEEVFVSENSSVVLTELRKFTEYQVSVSAYNRAGEGQMTSIRASTQEDRPGPVSQLSFSDILLDSVNVTWQAPLETNGEILGYLVNYKTYQLKSEFKKEIQEKTSLTYHVATGLEPNVTYFFSVRAETVIGYGNEVSGNVTISPVPGSPERPSKPRLHPGQTSVALDWQDGKSGDTPIKGHIIQAKRIARSTETRQASPELHNYERLEDHFLQSTRPQHVLGEWITLSNVQGRQSQYEVSYRHLEPSSFYVFRIFARNSLGAGYASPESEQLHVPASLPEDPFYTKWWFIVMIALVTFVVIVVVVALLCVTGNRYKYEKRNSVTSLHLDDGGIVSYELRASKRRNMPHLRRDIPARPNTTTSWISDSREPPAYGSIGDVAPPNNMYGSLATDVVLPERRNSALVTMGFARPCSVGNYSNHDPMLDGFSGDADSVDDPEEQEDQEPNIAQHYEHEDTYRQTWRRARDEALAEAGPMRQSRPASRDSDRSEVVMITSPRSNHGSSLINGFSSFV